MINIENFNSIIEGKKEKKFLFVDDDAIVRTVVKSLFEQAGVEGYKIVETPDRAIQEFKVFNYDVVIIDLNMPEKNGYEVAQELITIAYQQEKPVKLYAFTASPMQDVWPECLAAGFDGFLLKG